MPVRSTSSSSADDRGSSPRFTWPDVGMIALTIGFTIFLTYRGMTVHAAAVTAVSIIGATIIVLLLPRRINDIVKLLGEIKSGVGRM